MAARTLGYLPTSLQGQSPQVVLTWTGQARARGRMTARWRTLHSNTRTQSARRMNRKPAPGHPLGQQRVAPNVTSNRAIPGPPRIRSQLKQCVLARRYRVAQGPGPQPTCTSAQERLRLTLARQRSNEDAMLGLAFRMADPSSHRSLD